MVVKNFPDFMEWIAGALGTFGLIALVGLLAGVFFGY
jgi:hypothetical protein